MKMTVKDEIESRLQAVFAPDLLEVVNESHHHAGHSGDDGTGETHFAVKMRAPGLAALGRLARHRAVNQVLGDIPSRIHALSLDIG